MLAFFLDQPVAKPAKSDSSSDEDSSEDDEPAAKPATAAADSGRACREESPPLGGVQMIRHRSVSDGPPTGYEKSW